MPLTSIQRQFRDNPIDIIADTMADTMADKTGRQVTNRPYVLKNGTTKWKSSTEGRFVKA